MEQIISVYVQFNVSEIVINAIRITEEREFLGSCGLFNFRAMCHITIFERIYANYFIN